MTSPTDIINQALMEVGQRVQIRSITPPDGTPASLAASVLYTPKIKMLMRAAPWDSLRAQAALTLWKATVINGAISATPPPQPWLFSYLWPSDCLKLRFIQPTLNVAPSGLPLTTAPNTSPTPPSVPTSIPFVPATDFDANGNPIKVILTNLINAQAVYNRDLSPFPDLWDSMFTAAATALLGGYLINALARNKAQLDDQVSIAKGIIDQARTASANEAVNNIDHIPDWLRVRTMSSAPWMWQSSGPNGVQPQWESCELPNGQFF